MAELPVLRLGLVGFNSAQQALFETALASLRTRLQWKVAAVEQADALCLNGSRAQMLPDGSVQVAAGSPAAAPTRIDPRDTDRPLAFTTPLASGVATSSSFDLASPASTRSMLEKFEGWLRPMALQFCLASRVVQDRLDISSSVFHVSVDGRLLAIVSRRNGIGVLPIADPARLEHAVWSRRPELAGEIPVHFVQAPLAQVLWQYASRTKHDLLPAAYRSRPLHWCRSPQLPQRMFRTAHLVIVRELAQGAATFAELRRRTGLPEAELARCLGALRIVGAISHDRKQVLRTPRRRPAPEGEQPDDRTLPAPLMDPLQPQAPDR